MLDERRRIELAILLTPNQERKLALTCLKEGKDRSELFVDLIENCLPELEIVEVAEEESEKIVLDRASTKKPCSRCKEKKELSEFYEDKRAKGGRKKICKSCRSILGKERWAKKRKKKLEREAGAAEKKDKGDKVPWAIGGECRIENAEGKVIFENGKATCPEGEEWLRKKKLREGKSRGGY